MAGADREMKGVPCANIKLRLSGVAGRGVEILALDGKNPKAFRAKPGEGRKRGCAMIGAETADARLYRQRRSELRHSVDLSPDGSCLASQPCGRFASASLVKALTSTEVSR